MVEEHRLETPGKERYNGKRIHKSTDSKTKACNNIPVYLVRYGPARRASAFYRPAGLHQYQNMHYRQHCESFRAVCPSAREGLAERRQNASHPIGYSRAVPADDLYNLNSDVTEQPQEIDTDFVGYYLHSGSHLLDFSRFPGIDELCRITCN
jgi:hypothetical protein